MNWIELNLPFGVGMGCDDEPTFCGLGLNKPGVMTRTKWGDRLIGDDNTSGGTCSCCSMIDRDTIVQAYCVVWTPENAG